jgi:hypothetical protein
MAMSDHGNDRFVPFTFLHRFRETTEILSWDI